MGDIGVGNEVVDKGKGKEQNEPVVTEQKDTEMQTDNPGPGLSTDVNAVGSSSVSGTERSGNESMHSKHSTTS
jgi:hypothetical protein